MKQRCILFAAMALFLMAVPTAYAASGTVVLSNTYYVIVQLEPSYISRYTAGHMMTLLSDGLREGDKITGIEYTWGPQTWHVERAGKDIKVDVEKYDVPAIEALDYFAKNSKNSR